MLMSCFKRYHSHRHLLLIIYGALHGALLAGQRGYLYADVPFCCRQLLHVWYAPHVCHTHMDEQK